MAKTGSVMVAKNKTNIIDCPPLHLYEGVEQGTQEWLELRMGKVTCSNAKDLLVHGPAWCIKKNSRDALRNAPNENKYAMRGHVIEAEAKERFNSIMCECGLEIADYTFITNDFYVNSGYSPDGLVVDDSKDDSCNFIPLEVKAYNDYVEDESTGIKKAPLKHIKAVESFDNVPLEAKAQMQMEMLLTGASSMFLLLANPDCEDLSKRYKIWTVDFDPSIGERLADKLSGKHSIFEIWKQWPRAFDQFTKSARSEAWINGGGFWEDKEPNYIRKAIEDYRRLI